MRHIIFILLTLCTVCADAQIDNASDDIRALLGIAQRKAEYLGQTVSKHRTGVAFIAFKDGSVYYGDVVEGKPSGLGTMIAAAGDEIRNCPESFCYVGRFKDGKKQGNGKVYDTAGTLIHQGSFDNDAPSGEYMTVDINSDIRFMMVKDKGNSYFGEVVNNHPNGLGVLFYSGDESIQGKFSDGMLKGIGLIMQNGGEWTTVKEHDGMYITLSSSANYEALRQQRKSADSASWSAIITGFSSDMQKNIADMQRVKEERAALKGITVGGDDVADNSSSSSSKSKSTAKKKSNADSCTHCCGTGNCNYCNGDGYNYVVGTPVRCTSCTSIIGKCKWCKGTGKK